MRTCISVKKIILIGSDSLTTMHQIKRKNFTKECNYLNYARDNFLQKRIFAEAKIET